MSVQLLVKEIMKLKSITKVLLTINQIIIAIKEISKEKNKF